MADGNKPRRPIRSRAATTLEAGVAASMVFGKLACPSGSPSTTHEPPAPSVTIPPSTPAPSRESQALALLGPEAVLNVAPARRTLFTWTTRDQIDALERDRVLLTRTESPVHGPAYYDRIVRSRAAAGEALAAKLSAPGFARARFAWPNPWATILGWPGESYGDELIAVRLKPEAWTAKLVTSKPGWEVVDADNRIVDPAEVLRHPERIGAVYFVHDKAVRGVWRTSDGPLARAAFREYVLCNESMIESWSVGDSLGAATIARSTALIDAVLAELPDHAPGPPSIEAWNAEVARSVWPGPTLIAELGRTYEAALAFPNESYALTADRMLVLAARLRALTSGVPPPSASGPRPSPVAPMRGGTH